MAKDREYNKKGVTPEKIVAYVETKAGQSQSKVAAKLNKGQATICRWVGEVEDYLRQCPEYQEIAPRLAQMIPSALDVYDKNLGGYGKDGNDLNAARDVMKMIGVFIDRSKSDNLHRFDGSDADLAKQLDELGENADSRANIEADTSGESASGEHSEGTETPED